MKKKVLKVLGMGLSVYFVAFLAFILDLDGKALFYLYEPIVTKHFDDMPRKDIQVSEIRRSDLIIRFHIQGKLPTGSFPFLLRCRRLFPVIL